ncbi:MAG: signal peptidase I [Oscillospiraceae bacterium]|nr:signal peptidase I [Oscillospiraceae bacterium]MDD6527942.1 signal peptidase I [Oscillospiraceae bacterium]
MMQQDLDKKDKKEQTFKDKIVINFYDIASVLASAIVTIMLLFTFVFRVVGVVGTSMVPTLNDNDWLMVSAYDNNPSYGQVVIITQPNWFDEPIVKRIIATENQKVDIDFSTGKVSVDGKVLDEPYINNETINSEGVEFPVTVPEGCVFVMGDNRQGSTDSRSEKIGFIDERYIMGVVKYKLFSADEMTGKLHFNSPKEWKVR